MLKIYSGCRDENMTISSINSEHISTLEHKKLIIHKIIDNIQDEEFANFLINDMKYQLKILYAEYDDCQTCGDKTSYEEFEI